MGSYAGHQPFTAKAIDWLGCAVCVALALSASAAGGKNLLLTAGGSQQVYDWSGFYFGGHVGYSRGNASETLSEPNPVPRSNGFGSLYAGAQVGYNYFWWPRLLAGIEADLSFPNYLGRDDEVSSRISAARQLVTEKVDFVGMLRGRAGYTYDHWLFYATAGLAYLRARVLQGLPGSDDEQKALRMRTGATLGGGVEVAVAPGWTTRLEYLYSRFGGISADFPSGTQYTSVLDVHRLTLGLNRKLGGPETDAAFTRGESPLAAEFPNWNLHGQTTFVEQGYFHFRSPYEGANSLSGANQAKNTVSATAFLGLRLWEGGALYYAPEAAQGFGLSGTFGLGGFSNGEAQKAGFPTPHYNTSRLFLRQTFGLGGEQETIEDGPLQLAGKVDISRITVTVGRFFAPDFINNNAYADEPRTTFLNWAIWNAGAFDFPADQLGYSWGAFIELNQKAWAVRAGYALMPKESNLNNFDMQLFGRGAYLVETENRYTLFSQPGKLRLIGWINLAFAGSYAGALDLVALNPGLDATDALDQTRQGRIKYGFVVNLEQAISEQFGVFSRLSWNDGKNEIMSFTDIDVSASLGGVWKGIAWGRPLDRIGVAGAVNALSPDHRAFIAAGGLGILIGDGQLNYREEKILEAYYSLGLGKWTTLTFDYQFIADPAYNADRGPVSIYTARLHGSF
jgi:high affinity Mn2+ porin